jgi:glycosyltransferase involved in cell wall biosynthesis
MAAGVPVVSTRLGVEGLRVRDAEHVLLAETPRELAAAAARVISDDALARGLAERARALVERHYDWPVVSAPLLELHARLAR